MPNTLEPDGEAIDLKSTEQLDRAKLWGAARSASAPARPGGGVALVEGSVASLSGETHTLRRRRLLAAAVLMAATFGVLLIWVFASNNPGTLSAGGSRFSIRVGFLALRFLLAASVAGLLASKVSLTARQLRGVECVLFLGLSVVLMASQYFVSLDLMRRGPEYLPILLAFVKDGVIQMMTLMVIYGTLIPNPPLKAAKVVALMFTVPVVATSLLKLHPDSPAMVAELGKAEEAGSNLLFLTIGAMLAVCGSFLVNRLRTALHEARKFGQYRLIRRLGTGGMGEVYLAEHALLKRPCALKLIRPESGSDPMALARFEREVQSSAQLNHHNTIQIYDYGHANDGTFYYVMEYLKGLSLAELVRDQWPLPAGRVIYLLRQVCAGLAEAHALGLVHRDLKPANVFVAVHGGECDVVKVLDYGLVKVTGDPRAATLTAEMTVSGTPAYMAPEQATADRSLDTRADIYALGAMMYFTLTGRPPFDGTSAFAVMMAHVRDAVTPPSQILSGIPADLELIVLRCLAKRPEDRFASVRDLSDALAGCQSAGEWDAARAEAWWRGRGFDVRAGRPAASARP
jgi:serine/threonine-protein kinase